MGYAVVPLGAPAAHAVPLPCPRLETFGVADGVARATSACPPASGCPASARPLVSKRRPATTMYAWLPLRVDRDPLALAGLAPAHEAGGVERLVEHAGAVEGVGHRARAVVAGVLPLAVPAAVLVRLGGDPVARRDDRLDLRRRVGGRGREPSGPTHGLARRGRDRRDARRAARLDRGAQRLGRRGGSRGRRRGARRRRSHERTRRAVPRPNWPSTSVRKPGAGQEVLEDPYITAAHPVLSGRWPKVRLAARRPRPERSLNRGPRRPRRAYDSVTTKILSFIAYGVSCRARAERIALRRITTAIRPRARDSWPYLVPPFPPDWSPARFGVMSLTEARHDS